MPRPSNKNVAAQVERADALRKRMEKLASNEPDPTAPKSPREFTDEAAREQWVKEQEKGKKV